MFLEYLLEETKNVSFILTSTVPIELKNYNMQPEITFVS